METDAAIVVEYVPALQLVHVVAPVRAHVPAAHALQNALDAAPTDVENDPAAQLRHTVATEAAVPTVEEYFPTTHALHAVELVAAQNPAPHDVHVTELVALIVVDDDPAGQAKQAAVVDAAVPTVVEYVPALQLVHAVLEAAAQNPAPHEMHVVELEAPPDGEYDPAGQPRQTVDDTALIVLEYVPALHSAHVDDPAVPYVPARQPMHAVLEVAPMVVDNVPATHPRQTVDADAAVPT